MIYGRTRNAWQSLAYSPEELARDNPNSDDHRSVAMQQYERLLLTVMHRPNGRYRPHTTRELTLTPTLNLNVSLVCTETAPFVFVSIRIE